MYDAVLKLPMPADTNIIGFADNAAVVMVAKFPEEITQMTKRAFRVARAYRVVSYNALFVVSLMMSIQLVGIHRQAATREEMTTIVGYIHEGSVNLSSHP